MAADQRRVLLGHIKGAHGVRGDVIVKSYTAEPKDIAAYGSLEDDAGGRSFKMRVLRVTTKGVVVRIQGVGDRNGAEALKGVGLYARREQLTKPDDGEFMHADLIGLKAVDTSGAHIGEVVAMPNYGAGDLMEIRLAGSSKTELIPFTHQFVPRVDIADGRVVVATLDEGELGKRDGEG